MVFAMSYITDHQQKFDDLRFQIENQDQLRKQANGGNSILFCYTPNEENQYLSKAKEVYCDQAQFIDVSKLLVELIDSDGWDAFKDYYHDFKDTPRIVFKSEDDEQDLFDLILRDIKAASDSDKLPILIRTGCLYGTGIENVNIMEHKMIMNLSHPLVIFYPAKTDDENLYFLNFKNASKYRCTLVK